MLRTSLRRSTSLRRRTTPNQFLSSNAQDFIEDRFNTPTQTGWDQFLSSNAQDFIEDCVVIR